MSPAEKRIANLRAGLAYASKAHRPKILAMIAEAEAEQKNRASRGSAPESAVLAKAPPATSSRGQGLGATPHASPKGEDNGTLQSNTIGAAAQEPLAVHTGQAEAHYRDAGVEAQPGKSDRSEKVQAGVRLTSPEPSSEGGRIPGTAGSLAPCTSSGWRDMRRALRLAGHEVKQLDGVVYVDGQRCDDPALRAV